MDQERYFVDYDEVNDFYLVFYSTNNSCRAVASYADEKQAEKEASRLKQHIKE